MFWRQHLPKIWLISDARNDAVLERALKRMPRGSGFIYRHYHLDDPERWKRFRALRRVAKACGHCIILSDSALTARGWGADGIYGAPRSLYPRRRDLLRLATAHNLHEIGQSNRFGVDGVLISPIFATRSHPGGNVLGAQRFKRLSAYSHAPMIALGGMDAAKARALNCHNGTVRWAAIDGLS